MNCPTIRARGADLPNSSAGEHQRLALDFKSYPQSFLRVLRGDLADQLPRRFAVAGVLDVEHGVGRLEIGDGGGGAPARTQADQPVMLISATA